MTRINFLFSISIWLTAAWHVHKKTIGSVAHVKTGQMSQLILYLYWSPNIAHNGILANVWPWDVSTFSSFFNDGPICEMFNKGKAVLSCLTFISIWADSNSVFFFSLSEVNMVLMWSVVRDELIMGGSPMESEITIGDSRLGCLCTRGRGSLIPGEIFSRCSPDLSQVYEGQPWKKFKCSISKEFFSKFLCVRACVCVWSLTMWPKLPSLKGFLFAMNIVLKNGLFLVLKRF